MKFYLDSFLYGVVPAIFALLAVPATAQQPCENLKSVNIPHVTITAATAGSPGFELPAQTGFINTPAKKIPVPFCRVQAYSAPTSDSHIGIEVWLPDAANWNGNFLAAGNPGFIGSMPSNALADIMQRGYAAAGTDTGHVDEGFQWAIGHPEKWADWGYRAVHEMVLVTRQLIQGFYGKPVQYSYWNSCHNGGNQGLNEAQRYPEDFDGIVAADPAFYISHLQAGSLYVSWVALKDGVEGPGYIPPAKLAVINRAALDACDANDGLVDGLIGDPPGCKFDPASIECHGPDAASCLTSPQADTVKKIYAGSKYRDGTQIYSGFEPGSELNWNLMVEKEPFWVNLAYFKGMVFENPDWDFRGFDVDRDTRLAASRTGAAVDGNNPDLGPFKQAGGKLILVSSWNSTGLPPRQLTEYYRSVEQTMGGPGPTRDFARLFQVPGSGGCPGFRNAQDFDAFDALRQWVEHGRAPEKIIYSQRSGGISNQGEVYRTRPACVYPQQARYKGTGNPDDAANFSCVEMGK